MYYYPLCVLAGTSVGFTILYAIELYMRYAF